MLHACIHMHSGGLGLKINTLCVYSVRLTYMCTCTAIAHSVPLTLHSWIVLAWLTLQADPLLKSLELLPSFFVLLQWIYCLCSKLHKFTLRTVVPLRWSLLAKSILWKKTFKACHIHTMTMFRLTHTKLSLYTMILVHVEWHYPLSKSI